MGGGASLMEGVEELVTTTLLIGRAISAMQFPGMFRIYDFHSKRAPRLAQNAPPSFNFFTLQNGPSGNDDDDYVEPEPSAYQHFFKVRVNGDDIYLEDPLEVNDAGWTPLHTCCMSLGTVQAGIDLIEEIKRLGGTFETKTLHGPGNFNKEWTALQMACAYGVDPLVEKLVEAGADVNAKNCFGYSCLLEACHRGYADIARQLLKNPHVDINYIPDESEAMNSPFASAPAQSALAEAARCGYFKIVQMLIDAGAKKDMCNALGWTALHEACFYHRIETVKTLLLAGADATIRTNLGALPYHLSGLQEIRSMLENIGGIEAVPKEGDTIDMVRILTELTYGASGMDEEEDDEDGDETGEGRSSKGMATMVLTPNGPILLINNNSNKNNNKHIKTPQNTSTTNTLLLEDAKPDAHHHHGHSHQIEEEEEEKEEEEAVESKATTVHHKMPKDTSYLDPTMSSMKKTSPSKRADGKHYTPMSNKVNPNHSNSSNINKEMVPADMPKHFLCELTQKPMSEPVQTRYGNVYDKTAIMQWFATQGHICPLTGAPLSESDLQPMIDLANEIRTWILKKSLVQQNDFDNTSSVTSTTSTLSPNKMKTNGSPDAKKHHHPQSTGTPTTSSLNNEEDLYDF